MSFMQKEISNKQWPHDGLWPIFVDVTFVFGDFVTMKYDVIDFTDVWHANFGLIVLVFVLGSYRFGVDEQ